MLSDVNEKSVYNLSGCLSSCVKSQYDIKATTELRNQVC